MATLGAASERFFLCPSTICILLKIINVVFSFEVAIWTTLLDVFIDLIPLKSFVTVVDSDKLIW